MKLSARQRDALDACAPRRRNFVLEYALLGFTNATEAARRAEYMAPETEGTRLLGFAEVQAAVEALREPIINSKIASLEEQRERWSAIARGEVKDVAIVKDVGECEVTANLATRMKADEMLGRSNGAFVDRHEVTGAQGAPIAVTIDLASAKKIARGEQDG